MCRARVEDNDLAREPRRPAEGNNKLPRPNVELPSEQMCGVRDSTRERARNPRDRCKRPAGRATDGTPKRASRSWGQTPPLDERRPCVTGEATTGAEPERVRERAATTTARAKVHGLLYALLRQAPPSAATGRAWCAPRVRRLWLARPAEAPGRRCSAALSVHLPGLPQDQQRQQTADTENAPQSDHVGYLTRGSRSRLRDLSPPGYWKRVQPRVSAGAACTSEAAQPEAGSPVRVRSGSASAGCAEAGLCSAADDATAAPLQGSTWIIAGISLGSAESSRGMCLPSQARQQSGWGRACRLGRLCLSHPQLDSRPVPYSASSAAASKSQPASPWETRGRCDAVALGQQKACVCRPFPYSPGWTRTNNPPVNSRMLCQLSYRGPPNGRSIVAISSAGLRAARRRRARDPTRR